MPLHAEDTAVFQGANENRVTPSFSEFRQRLKDEHRVNSFNLADVTQWQAFVAGGNTEIIQLFKSYSAGIQGVWRSGRAEQAAAWPRRAHRYVQLRSVGQRSRCSLVPPWFLTICKSLPAINLKTARSPQAKVTPKFTVLGAQNEPLRGNERKTAQM